MQLIARILVTNSSRINQKRIINKFGSYLMARNMSSTQQQIEKTVQELTKENGELARENGNLIAELQKQKQDFEGRIAQLQNEKEEILNGKKLAEEEETQKLQMYGKKVRPPSEEWYTFATQIGDRRLYDNLQSFMQGHEHGDGDITLGRMEIIPPDVPNDSPMVQGCHEVFGYIMDLPDGPMPKNVTNFDGITLTDVNRSILDFLRKFKENNLLSNVQLNLSNGGKNHVLPMLSKILPLISNIYSINLSDLFDWIHENDDKEHEPLLKTVLAQTKILAISWHTRSSTKCMWEDKFDWCCSWLYSPRDDGMPRTLIANSTIKEPHCSSFIDRIKKDFLEADHPVSFYIRLVVPEDFQPEISLENNKTNEKLVIKAQAGRLLISRHLSKAAENKIEEEEKEITEWDSDNGQRQICLTQK